MGLAPQHILAAGLALLSLAHVVQCASPVEEPDTKAIEATPDPRVEPQRPRAPAIIDYGPCSAMLNVGAYGTRTTCVFDHEQEFRLWVEPEQVDEIEVFVDGRQVQTRPLELVDDASRGLGIQLDRRATRIEVGLRSQEKREALTVRSKTSGKHHRSDEQAIQHRIDSVRKLLREHRFEEAQRLLEGANTVGRRSPRIRAFLAYIHGELDWRRGRSYDALIHFRDASLHAQRSNEEDVGRAALSMYAEALAEQGYFQAALKWSRVGLDMVRKSEDACDLASTLRTTAWIHLLLRMNASSNLHPEQMLGEALAIFGPKGRCKDPDHTGGARASLALLEMLDGHSGDALRILRKTDRSRMIPGERVLASDVELRARLAQRQSSARITRALEELRQAVADAKTIDARWHLELREGQVLEARGKREAAIEAYRRAEYHLDALAQLATFGVGRTTMGSAHRESNERLAAALLAQDEPSAALCVARQAEARRVQAASLWPSLAKADRERLAPQVDALGQTRETLERLRETQRDAPVESLPRARALVAQYERRHERELDEILGQLHRLARPPACEVLHQPTHGELLLGIFPQGNGWLVFAHDEVETTAYSVDLRELDQVAARARLGELLLQQVAAQVQRARRIRVHAVGQAQQIDIDRLPWNGRPLFAHVPVVWGLDVAGLDPPQPPGLASPPRALLIADPTGSLPEADAEIRFAAKTLGPHGWSVHELAREDALPNEVLEDMRGTTLLHYAGHARHDDGDDLSDPGWWPPYPGGTQSWPASLRLADGTRLAAHEILMSTGPAPRKVILSACRTAAIDATAGGMSLAVAFLLAGAEEVLATSAATQDEDARLSMERVYAQLEPAEDWSLTEAHTRARRLDPTVGHGYRVYVR